MSTTKRKFHILFPNLYRGYIRLIINLSATSLIGVSLFHLLHKIGKHENLFTLDFSHEKMTEFSFPFWLLLTIMIVLLCLFSILRKGINSNRKVRNIFNNWLSNLFPLLGIILGINIFASLYPSFDSMPQIKQDTVTGIKYYMDMNGRNIENNLMSAGRKNDFVNESLNFPQEIEVTTKLNTDNLEKILASRSEKSYTFRDYSLERPERYQGGVVFNRDEKLQEELKETNNIYAYVKKEDFSEDKSFSLNSMGRKNSSSIKCYLIKYKVTYSNDPPQTLEVNNCEKEPQQYLRILLSSETNVKAVEAWLVDKNEKPESSFNNGIESIFLSEGVSKELFSVNLCLEVSHVAFPKDKYTTVLGNKTMQGYSIREMRNSSRYYCPFKGQ